MSILDSGELYGRKKKLMLSLLVIVYTDRYMNRKFGVIGLGASKSKGVGYGR